MDLQQLILHIVEVGSDLDLFAMTAWLIWQQRNHIRVGSPTIPLGQINTRAQQQLQDFYRVQPMKITSVAPNRQSTATCTPPHAPLLKVNYDGAVFRESNEASIGAVV